jgi:cell division protein FtsQ
MKGNLEARKNRLRRRLMGGFGESLGAVALLFAATFLSALFIYAASALLSASYFEIREISVRGLKELTEKDVLALAHVRPRSNILSVNTSGVAERIAANAWVKNVYVGREFPDRLVLDIRERKPIAIVKQDGAFYLMDAGGNVFKKLSGGDDVDLAILSGVNIRSKTLSPLVADALKLLESLSSADRYPFLGTVSEVHISDVFGLSLLTDKGLHLKMGRDNFDGKLRQLNLVLVDLEMRGMKDGHLLVDLADISKVTVQRKDTTAKAGERTKGPQYKL